MQFFLYLIVGGLSFFVDIGVFVLLVPEQATEEHLELLSELAQMFSEKTFRDQVATATDAVGIHRLFSTWAPATR